MANNRELIKVDKNGTKYWRQMVRCWKCNGSGSLSWTDYADGVCFDCHGAGEYEEITKEYTPEHQAKLEAQRAKRLEKKLAEERAKAHEINLKFFERNGFDAEGNIWCILGDTYSFKDELKEAGCKFHHFLGWHCDHELSGYPQIKLTASQICTMNEYGTYYDFDTKKAGELISEAQRKQEELTAPKASQYVGNIGDKIEMPVTFWKMSTYKVQAFGGYYNRDEPAMETKYIYSFIDTSGNCLIWNTTSFHQLSDGDKLILKGTIKRHSEYKGIKQTELQRCKITKEVTT